MTTKRPKQQASPRRCVNAATCGRDAENRMKYCWPCYQQQRRDSKRTTPKREQADLGDDQKRLGLKVPRVLFDRFHAAVPESQRSSTIRNLIEAHVTLLEQQNATRP